MLKAIWAWIKDLLFVAEPPKEEVKPSAATLQAAVKRPSQSLRPRVNEYVAATSTQPLRPRVNEYVSKVPFSDARRMRQNTRIVDDYVEDTSSSSTVFVPVFIPTRQYESEPEMQAQQGGTYSGAGASGSWDDTPAATVESCAAPSPGVSTTDDSSNTSSQSSSSSSDSSSSSSSSDSSSSSSNSDCSSSSSD